MRIFSKFSYLLLFFILFSNIVFCSRYPVHSEKAMVVSECPYATEVSVAILKKGGNAIDAAAAVAFTLAVTYPEAGNIGGGGFMVIHLADGTSTTLDFREMAPFKALRDMYLDENGEFNNDLSLEGMTAAGVPGSVAGVLYALQKYGTLPLSEVIQPSIDLAENGFQLSYSLANLLNSYKSTFLKYPSSSKIFVKENDDFKEGDLLVQKDLSNTLKLIRDNGHSGFYEGIVPELVVTQSKKQGGYFSQEDFTKYTVKERPPVIGTYKDYEIISMGPASSGGISLIQALNAFENINIPGDSWGSSKYLFNMTEILKYVYSNRSKHLGDMDFYPVPIDYLISKEYGKEISSKIGIQAIPSVEIDPVEVSHQESTETTHFCVLDELGNAVSMTTTINGLFGNKVVVEGAGFFLNNEMDDFSAKPGTPNVDGLLGSEANSISPGKRMLSSMTPTIILKDSKPFLIVGARGGSTIITQVLQVILNVLEFGMNIQQAIDAPRIHHQWMPDKIDYEKYAISSDVRLNLIERGQNIGRTRILGKTLGIQVDQEKQIIYGAPDSRGEGKAAGY